MFEYRARVIRVVDGDTLNVEVDCGFDVFHRLGVRLDRIDCPEMNTEAGKAAKVFTSNWVEAAGYEVIIRTVKDKQEKFGRYLAMVYASDEVAFLAEHSLNAHLVSGGHAVAYSGGKRG